MSAAGPLPVTVIGGYLGAPELGLVRAKGLMRDLDGQPSALQLVGARAAMMPSAHPRPEDGRLVCIGVRGQLDRATIVATVRRSRVTMETPTPHQG